MSDIESIREELRKSIENHYRENISIHEFRSRGNVSVTIKDEALVLLGYAFDAISAQELRDYLERCPELGIRKIVAPDFLNSAESMLRECRIEFSRSSQE